MKYLATLLLSLLCIIFNTPLFAYIPTHQSVSTHPLPEWFKDAKFGIMIHYGLYSVPGWAPLTDPTKGKFSPEFFKNNPYAEWYFNTMQIPGSPTYKHHLEKFQGKPYYDFQKDFQKALSKWNPEYWAQVFEKSGAKYVVFVAKHHDGFLLWPSKFKNPYRPDYAVDKNNDVLGKLTKAVRNHHMYMGIYYSGGYDWSWLEPGSGVYLPPITDLSSAIKKVPQTPGYAQYVYNHWHELIDTYKPDLIWNDIALPAKVNKWELFAHYYSVVPNGVLNNRWGQGDVDFSIFGQPDDRLVDLQLTYDWFDYYSPEYLPTYKLTHHKWEADHGPGYSFAYNSEEYLHPEHFKNTDQLIADLADLVSKNGNLLLAIGPMADGTIPPLELKLLNEIGDWLSKNGEAIYATKPWIKAEGFANHAVIPVRFTQSKDEKSLYVILLKNPEGGDVTLSDFQILDKRTKIEVLNGNAPIEVKWYSINNDTVVSLSLYKNIPTTHPISLKITPAPKSNVTAKL